MFFPLLSFVLNLLFLASSLWRVLMPCSQSEQCSAEYVDILIAGASLLALIFMGPIRFGGNAEFWSHKSAMYKVAARNFFAVDWAKATSTKAALIFALWLLIVTMRGTIQLTVDRSVMAIVHVFLFAQAAATITATALALVHFSLGLRTLVERFILRYTEGQHIDHTVSEWSLVTAMLRVVSRGLEGPVLVMGMAASTSLLIALIDIKQGHIMLLVPSLLTMTIIFFMLVSAARVTELCIKVPSIVNELSVEEDIQIRQLLVQHLQSSRAGLCCFGTLLTLSTVKSYTYFSIVAAVTIGTKVLNIWV